jgi:hypothetical protein
MLSLSLLMGEERAATVLRPALGILVTVNLIPRGLLVVDVRTALARAYRSRELTGLAAVCLIGGALLPLYLLVAGAAPRALLAAALFVAGGSRDSLRDRPITSRVAVTRVSATAGRMSFVLCCGDSQFLDLPLGNEPLLVPLSRRVIATHHLAQLVSR